MVYAAVYKYIVDLPGFGGKQTSYGNFSWDIGMLPEHAISTWDQRASVACFGDSSIPGEPNANCHDESESEVHIEPFMQDFW